MVKTWWAKIFIGLREGYTKNLHGFHEVEAICQEYVDEVARTNKVGLCVTVTPTRYVYKKNWEPGAIVGFIQYPKFPVPVEKLQKQALELGELLRRRLKQIRVSVMFPDVTVMLGRKE